MRNLDTKNLALLYEGVFSRFGKEAENLKPKQFTKQYKNLADIELPQTTPKVAPAELGSAWSVSSIPTLAKRDSHMIDLLNGLGNSAIPATKENFDKLGGINGIIDTLTSDKNWTRFIYTQFRKRTPFYNFMVNQSSHPATSMILTGKVNEIPIVARKRLLISYLSKIGQELP